MSKAVFITACHSYLLPPTPVYPRAWHAIYGVTTVWAAKQSRSCGCFLFSCYISETGYNICEVKILFKGTKENTAIHLTSSMHKILKHLVCFEILYFNMLKAVKTAL